MMPTRSKVPAKPENYDCPESVALAHDILRAAVEDFQLAKAREAEAYQRYERWDPEGDARPHLQANRFEAWTSLSTHAACNAREVLIEVIQTLRPDVRAFSFLGKKDGVPWVPRGVILDGTVWIVHPPEWDDVEGEHEAKDMQLVELTLDAIVNLDVKDEPPG